MDPQTLQRLLAMIGGGGMSVGVSSSNSPHPSPVFGQSHDPMSGGNLRALQQYPGDIDPSILDLLRSMGAAQ